MRSLSAMYADNAHLPLLQSFYSFRHSLAAGHRGVSLIERAAQRRVAEIDIVVLSRLRKLPQAHQQSSEAAVEPVQSSRAYMYKTRTS